MEYNNHRSSPAVIVAILLLLTGSIGILAGIINSQGALYYIFCALVAFVGLIILLVVKCKIHALIFNYFKNRAANRPAKKMKVKIKKFNGTIHHDDKQTYHEKPTESVANAEFVDIEVVKDKKN
jgi:hypothetical protein